MAIDDEQLTEVTELIIDAEHCQRLSEWERGFIEDFGPRVKELGTSMRISPRQWDVLARIKEKVYAT